MQKETIVPNGKEEKQDWKEGLITVGSSFAKCKAKVENYATADEVHIAPEAGTWVYLKASNGVGLFKLVPKA